MSNQKKGATKKAPIENVTVAEEVVQVAEVSESVPAPKKAVKLNDTVTVNVQSNVFGELIYSDNRSGANVRWNEFGDVQPMTIGDLRAMRNTQRAFFSNNWIFVKEVLDDEFEDVTPEEIYKNLMVSQYYKGVLNPDNFNSIFRMDESAIREHVGMMSSAAKMNLIVASNDAIRRGKLDSLRKIRVLEEVLGCELVEL